MKLSVFLSVISLSFLAVAQTNSVSTTIGAPTKSTLSNVILGFKSTNDSGRAAYINEDNQRVGRSKDEGYLGYRTDSGWGGFFNAVQTYSSIKNNEEKSKWDTGDASITLVHPEYYKDGALTLSGQFRYYLRTSDRSDLKKIDQYAYYFRLNSKLDGVNEIFNEVVPRYFNMPKYSKTDSKYYLEDTFIYTYKLDKSWKIGAKSWAQYATYDKEPAGYSVDLGPMATYSVSSYLNISPSINFPVAVKNYVYDGAKSVSLDQTYVSLLLQARL